MFLCVLRLGAKTPWPMDTPLGLAAYSTADAGTCPAAKHMTRCKLLFCGGTPRSFDVGPHMNQPARDLIKKNVLREMADAIAARDWQASHALLDFLRNMQDPEVKADLLNSLLLMPGHQLHQAITREIQLLRSPSSIPYIRHMLAGGFKLLEYTCSESGVIAKWFSHALADINTPESIAVIKEFAVSPDPDIAEEMASRLRRKLTQALK